MIKRFISVPLFVPLAVALTMAVVVTSGCSDGVEKSAVTNEVSGFIQTDVVLGNGDEAVKGKTVSVHYTGWLYDDDAPENKGVKFDSSVDRGQLFDFPLGAGRVIKGWDQGVAGMRVGGKRSLVIPSNLAYGARGAGRLIPANATLVFDVELFNVR